MTQRREVEPFVSKIREAADQEKNAFGFLPSKAYDDFAYQGRMVLAVNSSNSLAGYTLFGGASPQGRIFQTWTNPKFRGQGIGRKLIGEVIHIMEKSCYLSVRADVAGDLNDANAFYGGLGFDVIFTRPGGKTRGRTINVRVRELSTPSLLDFADSTSTAFESLSLGTQTGGRAPLYVLDLNVIFDITKQRSKSPLVSRIMSAAFENTLRLAITAELIQELQRNSLPGQLDPILEFAKTLPVLPFPSRSTITETMEELAPIVFPERTRDQKLTTQDHSDLRHLVVAIHECATGFITSEKAILRSAPTLKRQYGLDIMSPDAFIPDQEDEYGPDRQITASTGTALITINPVQDEDYCDIATLMSRAHASEEQIRSVKSRGTATLPRRRFIVRAGGQACALAAWESPGLGGGYRELILWGDEANPATAVGLEHLLGRLAKDICPQGLSIFRLTVPPSQPLVRKVAIGNGFFLAKDDGIRSRILTKLALGRIVTPENWGDTCKTIRERSKVSLPSTPSNFVSLTQPIQLQDQTGKTANPTLSEIERLLSPALIILPNRPAVVLPITQAYAEDLFHGSQQPSLLSQREALLHSVRGYISTRNSHSVIREGAIAVFYESSTGGGRSAMTAIARISRRYLMDKSRASQYATTKGVLDEKVINAMGVGKQVCVSEFEDLMLFRKPVPLAALRNIGCVDGANFVTARAISTDHLLAIIKVSEQNA